MNKGSRNYVMYYGSFFVGNKGKMYGENSYYHRTSFYVNIKSLKIYSLASIQCCHNTIIQ